MMKADFKERAELEAQFKKLDKEDQERLLRLLDQMVRVRPLGLAIRFDQHTEAFFIADVATNCVIAPPPMNLATVTAWLDDYEKEAAEE